MIEVKTYERIIEVYGKKIYLMTVGDPGNDIYVAVYRRKVYGDDEYWDIVPGFLSYGNSFDLNETETPDDSNLVKELEPYVKIMIRKGIGFAEETNR